MREWTERDLVHALGELEHSRATHLQYRNIFAQRRRAEKAQGMRHPTWGDVDALGRVEWLKDPDMARRRSPSRREQKRLGTLHDQTGDRLPPPNSL
jgi:hypothetical protein